MAADKAQDIWDRVKTRLRLELGEDVFSSWFARAELECGRWRDGADLRADQVPQVLDRLALSGPSHRALADAGRDGAAYRAAGAQRGFRRALHRGAPCRAEMSAEDAVRQSAAATGTGPSAAGFHAPGSPSPRGEASDDALIGSPLDARLTFESFCVGRSNELAAAAARRVAADREIAYNPPDAARAGGAGQDASPPGHRARGAGGSSGRPAPPPHPLPDGRALHVPLRGGLAVQLRPRLQGPAARHRHAAHRRRAIPAGSARCRPSSATCSTRCSTPAVRSSSPPTGPPTSWRASTSGCARALPAG